MYQPKTWLEWTVCQLRTPVLRECSTSSLSIKSSPPPHWHSSLPPPPHCYSSLPPPPHYHSSLPPPLHYYSSLPPPLHYHSSLPPPLHYHSSLPPPPHYHSSLPPPPHYHSHHPPNPVQLPSPHLWLPKLHPSKNICFPNLLYAYKNSATYFQLCAQIPRVSHFLQVIVLTLYPFTEADASSMGLNSQCETGKQIFWVLSRVQLCLQVQLFLVSCIWHAQ